MFLERSRLNITLCGSTDTSNCPKVLVRRVVEDCFSLAAKLRIYNTEPEGIFLMLVSVHTYSELLSRS